MTDDGLVGRDVGGFRLTELLGRGAKAAVYRAVSLEDPAVVRAIKVIHPELVDGRDFVVRLLEEARLLSALRSEHVERCFDVRRDNGLLLVELELLEGRPLSDHLSEHPAGLPFLEALAWAHVAALGVAEAHRRGVVHGDLEPANLFLTEGGGLKVRDFAVARVLDETERARGIRNTGGGLLRARHLAPEAMRGAAASPASDVYALLAPRHPRDAGKRYPPPPSAFRRRTVLFQYGGPRLGERVGTSPGSRMFSRYRATLAGSVTTARSLMRPPHLLHVSTSNPNVCFRSSAHGRYVPARFGGAFSASGAGAGTVSGSGAMRFRQVLAAARTRAYLTV